MPLAFTLRENSTVETVVGVAGTCYTNLSSFYILIKESMQDYKVCLHILSEQLAQISNICFCLQHMIMSSGYLAQWRDACVFTGVPGLIPGSGSNILLMQTLESSRDGLKVTAFLLTLRETWLQASGMRQGTFQSFGEQPSIWEISISPFLTYRSK